MGTNDYWTDTLRRKKKADEDRYFAEQIGDSLSNAIATVRRRRPLSRRHPPQRFPLIRRERPRIRRRWSR